MFQKLMLWSVVLMLGATAAAAEDLSHVEWQTNYDEPPIGDPANAQKGGVFKTFTDAYPLTMRLVGPNSNDAFSGWKRSFTQDFVLVNRHPVTDNYIPWMATHWSIQPDHRTVYYKLDPDAQWSDGKPVTAADYVFCFEMMQSEHIVDPFYNEYFKTHFEDVVAINDYTLKVVGKHESWRPLTDFALWAMPAHAHTLGPDWVQEHNNVVPPVQGPYTIGRRESGQFVEFDRIKDWWGADKHYMQGMYNADVIRVVIISDSDRAFDFFKKGEIDYYRVTTAKKWAEEMEFEAIKKGWAHRKRVFVDYPQGLYGFAMNLEKPVFQNKDFRKALQYMFNFEKINDKLMYNAYFRQVSAFTGTEYANPNLRPYGFDPRKAREHLEKAGFAKRGKDGIFADANGNRAAFTLSYGNKGLERHFTVMKQDFQRLGVDVALRLLEPGTAFKNGLERQYEMTTIARTSNFFPSPKQYFHSVFTETTNNNNIFSFGSPETDQLIEIYEFDLDKGKRLAAMHELDAKLQDEAFWIPFWHAPFLRFLYWDHVKFPAFFFPKRVERHSDWQVFWVDTEAEERLRAAMKNGEALGEDVVVDVDPYGVKAAMKAAAGAPEGAGS